MDGRTDLGGLGFREAAVTDEAVGAPTAVTKIHCNPCKSCATEAQ